MLTERYDGALIFARQRHNTQTRKGSGTPTRDCSDAEPGPGEDKSPWRQRKEAYIASLAEHGGDSLQPRLWGPEDWRHPTCCQSR